MLSTLYILCRLAHKLFIDKMKHYLFFKYVKCFKENLDLDKTEQLYINVKF